MDYFFFNYNKKEKQTSYLIPPSWLIISSLIKKLIISLIKLDRMRMRMRKRKRRTKK